MTPEDLMKPRYKVIPDWPGGVYDIGRVLTRIDGDMASFYDKYPHLFRKMHWSSERKPEDLPKYVGWYENGEFKWVSPVVKWVNTDKTNEPLECIISFTNLEGEYEEQSINQFQLYPATQSSYDQYINSKQ